MLDEYAADTEALQDELATTFAELELRNDRLREDELRLAPNAWSWPSSKRNSL
ncbi:MAG: hypothetical protein QM811_01570 [Pirellulales bacterium]